jgi:hypothetical protein
MGHSQVVLWLKDLTHLTKQVISELNINVLASCGSSTQLILPAVAVSEDEASINIWEDKWLQNLTTYAVQSPIRRLDKDARVMELIERH